MCILQTTDLCIIKYMHNIMLTLTVMQNLLDNSSICLFYWLFSLLFFFQLLISTNSIFHFKISNYIMIKTQCNIFFGKQKSVKKKTKSIFGRSWLSNIIYYFISKENIEEKEMSLDSKLYLMSIQCFRYYFWLIDT